MLLTAKEVSYFDRTQGENDRYWRRFSHIPEIKHRRVMEIGCGYGALCIDAAQRGAAHVVGIDLEAQRISVAHEYLQHNYPELVGRIEFHCMDVMDYPQTPAFDYVISKDTFEHIISLETVLQAIQQRLQPGGRLYTGFGPLYHAPYGDHCRLAMHKYGPWGHLLLSEARLIRRLRQKDDRDVTCIADLGLNRLSVAAYQRIFKMSGLSTVEFQTNVVGRDRFRHKTLRQMMRFLSRLPGLETYLTANIYAVLEKPAD